MSDVSTWNRAWAKVPNAFIQLKAPRSVTLTWQALWDHDLTDDQLVWPSLVRITSMTGLSRSTVLRALSWLKHHRFIEKSGRRDRTPTKSTCYRLNLDPTEKLTMKKVSTVTPQAAQRVSSVITKGVIPASKGRHQRHPEPEKEKRERTAEDGASEIEDSGPRAVGFTLSDEEYVASKKKMEELRAKRKW